MSHRTKNIALGLLAAALGVSIALSVVFALQSSEASSHSAEVRITARLDADSQRVEFALQSRQSGATWGDRILPANRYFPLSATPNRWLVSTPITLDTPPAGTMLDPAHSSSGGSSSTRSQRPTGGCWEYEYGRWERDDDCDDDRYDDRYDDD